jgi:C1A family cysteine protease
MAINQLEKSEFVAMIMIMLRDRINQMIKKKIEDTSCWDFQAYIRFYIELIEDNQTGKKTNELSSLAEIPSGKDFKFELYQESIGNSDQIMINKER